MRTIFFGPNWSLKPEAIACLTMNGQSTADIQKAIREAIGITDAWMAQNALSGPVGAKGDKGDTGSQGI